jgi:protein-S-isoprenylcysteine O-methyltransferase Ste14
MTGASRWGNVPVPEWHVAGLLGGGLLHWLRPWALPIDRSAGFVIGSGLVFLGLVLIGWSVRAVGHQSIDAPETLVTTGPYRYSRNPMYVAWTALYVGLALVADAAWPLALLPAVAALTHRTIRREERTLAERFGGDYAAYRERVRRYL